MYFWLMNFQQENKAAVIFEGDFDGEIGNCRKPVLVLGAGEPWWACSTKDFSSWEITSLESVAL